MVNEGRQPGRGQTPLEGDFGFQNSAFGKYMSIRDPEGLRDPRILNDFSERMQRSSHPLVKLAAGWASAEYGMFNGTRSTSRLSPRRRDTALTTSGELWRQAADGLAALVEETPDLDLKYRYFAMQINAQHALAALPSMRVIAALRSGEPLPEAEMDMMMRTTVQETVANAKTVYDMNEDEIAFKEARRKACHKFLTHLLLQTGVSSEFALVPSPIREAFSWMRDRRSDLIAEPLSPAYRRRRVKITTTPEKLAPEDDRFIIVPRRDLPLYPGTDELITLERYIQAYEDPKHLRHPDGAVQVWMSLRNMTKKLGGILERTSHV